DAAARARGRGPGPPGGAGRRGRHPADAESERVVRPPLHRRVPRGEDVAVGAALLFRAGGVRGAQAAKAVAMTLRRLLLVALVVIGGMLAGVGMLLYRATRASIVRAADSQREAAAAKIAATVEAQLGESRDAIAAIHGELGAGLLGADAAAREASLYEEML